MPSVGRSPVIRLGGMSPPCFRPVGLQATPGCDRRLAVKSGGPLCACGPLCKSERGCECPWGRNKGGGVGRRPTPGDIRPQGHSHPAPGQFAAVALFHQSEEEQKKAPGCPGAWKVWWAVKDSNLGPIYSKSTALPT